MPLRDCKKNDITSGEEHETGLERWAGATLDSWKLEGNSAHFGFYLMGKV